MNFFKYFLYLNLFMLLLQTSSQQLDFIIFQFKIKMIEQKELIQGIGIQVAILFLPICVLIGIIIYSLKPYASRFYTFLFGSDNPNLQGVRPERLFEEQQCGICLQRIEYKVSPTCGHAICGNCLLDIYTVRNDKINCPTCRKPVTTILKLFNNSNPETQQQKNITEKIREYNNLFNDNRGIIRCLFELPYLMRHLRNIFTDPRFFTFIFVNFWRFRLFFLLAIYIISPFDILPQGIIGIVGLIDDIIILIVLIAVMSQVAMQFMRQNNQ